MERRGNGKQCRDIESKGNEDLKKEVSRVQLIQLRSCTSNWDPRKEREERKDVIGRRMFTCFGSLSVTIIDQLIGVWRWSGGGGRWGANLDDDEDHKSDDDQDDHDSNQQSQDGRKIQLPYIPWRERV